MLRRASLVVVFLVLAPATVEAHHHHHHVGGHATGGGCGGTSTSSSSHVTHSGSSSSPSPSVPVETTARKRVFVTASTYSGAIGGLAAADAFCQESADALALGGTYKAFLGDATTDVDARIADVGPWYTTGGSLAFASKASLYDAPTAQLLDEEGIAPTSDAVWTGSTPLLRATGQDCDGWTNATASAHGTTGTARAGDTGWAGGDAELTCDLELPIVCFEQ